MSVTPHSGIVDFGTFTSPTGSQDGIQGEVPAPLSSEIGFALTTEGWAPFIPPGSLGSMAYQNADSVAIIGGTIDDTPIGDTTASTGKFTSVTTPSVTATTDSLTLSAISTGSVVFSTASGRQVQIDDNALTNGSYLQFTRINSTNEQRIIANAITGGNNFGISATGAGTVNIYTSNGTVKQFVTAHTASAVNYVQVTGGTTNNAPVISAQGSNTNINLSLTPKGTGSVIANGTFTATNIDNTPIGATTPSTGKFTTLQVENAGANAGLTMLRNTDSPTNSTRMFFDSSNGSTSIYNSGNLFRFSTAATIGTGSGVMQMAINHTASAVNYVQVTGGATTARPAITAQGSDSNIGLSFSAKGSGNILFFQGGSTTAGTNQTFQITNGGTANYFSVSPSNVGNAPQFSALGSDTNISMAFQPKGTGAIDLAAGSSGVNISNGGTVTAITRTATGSNYTSIPSVAISAPTTAGGVQATATATMFAQSPSVASGGTGYTVGDTLTLVGGTFSAAATLTVSTVSAGVITAVTLATGGTAYSVLPTNPISVTGGTGTGCTLNITDWRVNTTFTITNAGSGYIEQPTVTFSGGGGSGASAYATVGSIPKVQTLGSAMSFYTPGGEGFRITDTSTTATNYINAQGGTASANPLLSVAGSGTNVPFQIASKGTSSFNAYTNTTTLQFAVSHTASAVNYVQVTGAATTARPTISAQGSDTNINMAYSTKGTGQHVFYANNSGTIQFIVNGTGSNYLVANTGANLTAAGTDTNINLALTPKGTGTVQFGTYTAGVLAATGYITITDSGGTTRRLLVG